MVIMAKIVIIVEIVIVVIVVVTNKVIVEGLGHMIETENHLKEEKDHNLAADQRTGKVVNSIPLQVYHPSKFRKKHQ